MVKLSRTYSWRRTWRQVAQRENERGGHPLADDSVPREAATCRQEPVTFDEIKDKPCLILLGAPGMGKSTWFKQEEESLSEGIRSAGHASLWLNLRSCRSEAALKRDLFQSQAFQDWTTGDHALHLFLDSLDEFLLAEPRGLTILIDELARHSMQRLRLRILCRSGDWPADLEERLSQMWSQGGVEKFRLEPLSDNDVKTTAKEELKYPDRFLRDIDDKELNAFAAKPQNLVFLIKTFEKDSELPRSRIDLYEKNLKWLCDEFNEDRLAAGETRTLTPNQAFSVACRIAYLTTFGHRPSVWKGPSTSPEASAHDLLLADISGEESLPGFHDSVTDSVIRECLATGLFESAVGSRMVWAHQMYDEFLAAKYLIDKNLPPKRIMALLKDPEDDRGRVVRVLRETASWLALMGNDKIFKAIVELDPQVCTLHHFDSDTVHKAEKRREKIVSNLLKHLNDGRLLDYTIDTEDLGDLRHPRLEGQLRKYIVDSSMSLSARRNALSIAQANEVQGLLVDILHVALNPQESHEVGRAAMRVILLEGDGLHKAALKPLAQGSCGADPDDELKGRALMALWPDHLTADELFAMLTPPNQRNFLGTYQWSFLGEHLPNNLEPSHLPAALRWVRRTRSRSWRDSVFAELIAGVMVNAWQCLNIPGVLDEFVTTALFRMESFDAIFPIETEEERNELIFRDDGTRLKAVQSIIESADSEDDPLNGREHLLSDLVNTGDLHWLSERMGEADSDICRRIYGMLVVLNFDRENETHLQIACGAAEDVPFLKPHFERRLTPSPTSAPTFERDEPGSEELQQPTLSQAALCGLLDEFEAGDNSALERIVATMVSRPPGTSPYEARNASVTTWVADQLASAELEQNALQRLLDAARAYLDEAGPDFHWYLVTNQIRIEDRSGYEALRLLQTHEPDTFPAEMWARWCCVLFEITWREDDKHEQLMRIACRDAPEEFIEAALLKLEVQSEEYGFKDVLVKLESCWDDRIAKSLLEAARDGSLQPKVMGLLIERLLAHDVEEARQFAESLLPNAAPLADSRKKRALAAAKTLLMQAPGAGWSLVWQFIVGDKSFGRELLLRIYEDNDLNGEPISGRLSEEQLADLYILMVRLFPRSKDPIRTDRVIQGPKRSMIRFWRDSIPAKLERRGTREAVEALKRMIRERPEDEDILQWSLHLTQDARGEQTRLERSPKVLLEIARDPHNKVVRLYNWVKTKYGAEVAFWSAICTLVVTLISLIALIYSVIIGHDREASPIHGCEIRQPWFADNSLGPKLVQVADTGTVQDVCALLHKGAPVSWRNPQGITPLMAAASVGNLKVLEVLIGYGADVNTVDRNGETALQKAAAEGHTEAIVRLRNRGAKVNTSERRGLTPLMVSVQGGHCSVADMLLRYGADPNASDKAGSTALMYAAQGKDERNCVRILLENKADATIKDKQGMTALDYAKRSGRYRNGRDIREHLIQRDRPEAIGVKGLIDAIRAGQRGQVERILDAGVAVNQKSSEGVTPLMAAIETPPMHINMATLLLRKGADPNLAGKGDLTPLMAALRQDIDREPLVELLLHYDADVNTTDKQGKTPLIHAAMNAGSDYRVFDMLIDKGAQVNAADSKGRTALVYAVQEEQATRAFYSVTILLEHGANPNAKDSHGVTPVSLALQSGNVVILRHLIEKGGNVDLRGPRGETPLMLACKKGDVGLVEELVRRGANVESRDTEGRSAFGIAVQNNHVDATLPILRKGASLKKDLKLAEVALRKAVQTGDQTLVKLILARQVNPNAKGPDGMAPLHYAVMCRDSGTRIIPLLIKFRADPDIQNADGTTPLMMVASDDRPDSHGLSAARELVGNGARLEVKDTEGQTALIRASSAGRVRLVKFLLQEGANPNACDSRGFTALGQAHKKFRADVIEVLKTYGADENCRRRTPKTSPETN